MRLSPRVANTLLTALCRRLDGGSLVIYPGDPCGADGVPPESPIITLLFLPKSSSVAVDGEVSLRVSSGAADYSGKPTWFAAYDSSYETVLEGTVGITKYSDIQLDKPRIICGDVFNTRELTLALSQGDSPKMFLKGAFSISEPVWWSFLGGFAKTH